MHFNLSTETIHDEVQENVYLSDKIRTLTIRR